MEYYFVSLIFSNEYIFFYTLFNLLTMTIKLEPVCWLKEKNELKPNIAINVKFTT